MPVYRESPTPAIETLLSIWWSAEKDVTRNALSTCIERVMALTLMIHDLKAQPDLYINMDAETVDDARDLITIVSFLLCGPLYGILTALRRKAETHTYKRTFDRPGHFWQTLEILESILVSGRRKPVTITPIVPIELLMRLVTARKKWDSLEYRNLNIAKSRGLSAGLPKTTFPCIGAMPNSDRVYIISTSADHWRLFGKLNDFVLNLRHSRRKGITNAVHGGGKDAKLVKEWSEALESRRKRSEEKNQKMEPLASLIENPPGYFSHLHDVATPFEYPSFELKARCTRCQVLFRYEVPDNVKVKEKVESHKIHLGFTCAETYAHFFCRALEQQAHAVTESIHLASTEF
ncbi:hypothetical protein FVEG_03520 [Fusarium verticillioides 7600]|uniref:Uncharacterized protein n=1 Tax=Gibberella moniliformis (strain M3125 / FGSC 7600) TaxID=334819 RepID=W7M1J3_GIBM7|nr:hypothetical protein FVEG_03520 [Fusarium verticillioides 7600]EWG41390.1 hypothetical protein FVEG_03520 [Fusarium verticillioides 7600]